MAHIAVIRPGISGMPGVWKVHEPVRRRDAGLSLDAGMRVARRSPEERVRKALFAVRRHFSRTSITGASSPVRAKRALHGLGTRRTQDAGT